MGYRSAVRTHIGMVRQRNEDAVLDRAEIGLWAVADGAGGHERGDYASACIVEALAAIDAAYSGDRLVQEVRASLSRVNNELRAKATVLGPNALICTTVVTLLIDAGQARVLWAGDSRLYLMRAGRLGQLTRDQSYVQDLVDRGEITREEAAGHPLSNIVTNLVGGSDELIFEERHERRLFSDRAGAARHYKGDGAEDGDAGIRHTHRRACRQGRRRNRRAADQ